MTATFPTHRGSSLIAEETIRRAFEKMLISNQIGWDMDHPEVEKYFQHLLDRRRIHHTIVRTATLLEVFDDVYGLCDIAIGGMMQNPDQIRAALLFESAGFAPDEDRLATSTRYITKFCHERDVVQVRNLVHGAINPLQGGIHARDDDKKVIANIMLSLVGLPWSDFFELQDQLAAEYQAMWTNPKISFRDLSTAWLDNLLSKERRSGEIYSIRYFQQRFGEKASHNIHTMYDRLTSS